MEMRLLSTPAPLAWCDGSCRVVVERPTPTDTRGVFGCEFQPTPVGKVGGNYIRLRRSVRFWTTWTKR